jgi:hypothetical protein
VKKNLFRILFYPMLFFRKPVLATGSLISLACFLGFLISAFFATTQTAIFFLIISFIVFMICQLYDFILLKINPTNLDLTLYQ